MLGDLIRATNFSVKVQIVNILGLANCNRDCCNYSFFSICCYNAKLNKCPN